MELGLLEIAERIPRVDVQFCYYFERGIYTKQAGETTNCSLSDPWIRRLGATSASPCGRPRAPVFPTNKDSRTPTTVPVDINPARFATISCISYVFLPLKWLPSPCRCPPRGVLTSNCRVCSVWESSNVLTHQGGVANLSRARSVRYFAIGSHILTASNSRHCITAPL
jgi:hypothetical protein